MLAHLEIHDSACPEAGRCKGTTVLDSMFTLLHDLLMYCPANNKLIDLGERGSGCQNPPYAS